MKRKISILGHVISIETVSTQSKLLDKANGVYYLEKKKIIIDNSLMILQQERVITHEIIHAMIDIGGLKPQFKLQHEEMIVDFLEHAMHSFLKNNTNFFRGKLW